MLLVSDCDGVLTDGFVPRRFSVKDGLALQLVPSVILTASFDAEIRHRASDLGVPVLMAKDKLTMLKRYCEQTKVDLADVWYIGDDLPDLDCIKAVGKGCCPADAVKEVKQAADYVCKNKGGQGAVREIVDMWRKQNANSV